MLTKASEKFLFRPTSLVFIFLFVRFASFCWSILSWTSFLRADFSFSLSLNSILFIFCYMHFIRDPLQLLVKPLFSGMLLFRTFPWLPSSPPHYLTLKVFLVSLTHLKHWSSSLLLSLDSYCRYKYPLSFLTDVVAVQIRKNGIPASWLITLGFSRTH